MLPSSWIGRINIKMSVLPKASYRVNAIPIKIPTHFFVDLERAILNLIWKNRTNKQTDRQIKQDSQDNPTQ